MEMSPSLIYWITRFDPFNRSLEFGIFVTGIVAGIFGMTILFFGNDNDYSSLVNSLKHNVKILVSFFVSFIVIHAFVPTTREMIAIYVVPKIVNSKNTQKISNEFYCVALDWMKEMNPNKKVGENK